MTGRRPIQFFHFFLTLPSLAIFFFDIPEMVCGSDALLASLFEDVRTPLSANVAQANRLCIRSRQI